MRPFDPRLLRYARATAPYLVACVLVGVFSAGLAIAQASLLADAIAAVSLAGLVPLCGIVLARALLARALLAWGLEVVAHRSSAGVKASLRSRVVRQALSLGPGWLVGERKAALTMLLTTGLDALDGYFARYLPQLVLAVVVPGGIAAWLLFEDPVAAVTVAVTLPLIPLFMALVGLATRDRANRRWRALAVLAHHFADVVAGLPTLKVFGRAKTQALALRRVGEQHRRESLSLLRVAFLSGLVLELVATFSVALVAVGVGLRVVEGRLDLRTALLVLVLAPEAYLPLRLVGTHFHASADGLAAASEAFRILETPAPVGSLPSGHLARSAGPPCPVPRGEDPSPTFTYRVKPCAPESSTQVGDRDLGTTPAEGDLWTKTWPPSASPLVVEGLTIAYGEPVVEGLSFEVHPGQLVALSGPSGAGKSSVLGALLRFIPYSGTIRVGGTDLQAIPAEEWRATLGWVPQRPYLLAGSIAGNVRLGRPNATSQAVKEALTQAGASELDPGTQVGEGGTRLSEGQRRRVALARALIRDAPLLLLDEPTAGVDADTEAEIAAALKGRTVVLVTHHAKLLAQADRVVEVRPCVLA